MGAPTAETGVIYCDDSLGRLTQLPDDSVDLVYLDPPFFSNRIYEVIWGDEAEVRSFEDRWEGGVKHGGSRDSSSRTPHLHTPAGGHNFLGDQGSDDIASAGGGTAFESATATADGSSGNSNDSLDVLAYLVVNHVIKT